MKTPAFTVTGVMACLMLLSQPVNAQTEARAIFNLQAQLKEPTCNQALTSSGDADGGGNVDFGAISLAETNMEKTKHVVLRLTCDSASLPFVAGIGFKVVKGYMDEETGHLYPKMMMGDGDYRIPANLWYDWTWGKNINEAVADKPGEGYPGLKVGQKVDLSQQTPGSQYLLVQKEGKVTWDFPVDITRKLEGSISSLPAGDYIAAVQVNISYD
ncbi:hypothetical protein DQZ30_02410 [Salmonella enterica subsp. diarizonae]|nr:hypothetical protein [Salmonella enterica subsp. diarizonae]